MGWKDQSSAAPPPAPQSGGWQSQSTPAVQPDPDPTEANKLAASAPGMKDVDNPLDAFYAGLHMSASGLALNKGNPGQLQVPANASFFQKTMAGFGQGLGDLPFSILGAVGGAAAGAEGGPLAIATGGAGAMALPQATREVMTDYYKSTHAGAPKTFGDFAAMIAHSTWNTAKAAVVGAVAGPVAGKAGSLVADTAAPAFAPTVARATTFAATATGVQAGLDGKAPDLQDFGVAAVTALGMEGAAHLAPTGKLTLKPAGQTVNDNSQTIYRQTGIPPWQQAHDAKGDPVLDQEMKTQDVNGDPVTPKFNSQRPPEHPPFKASGSTGEEGNGEWGHAQVAAHVEELLPQIRGLERSGDNAISPKGAVGRYQIEPGTARQYGFDPSKLTDPAYNETVARTVLGDLSRRFHGDTEAVLVAYNAGPGRAFRFIRDGRDTSELPTETQNYLIHAGFGGKGGKPPVPPEPPQEPGEAPGDENARAVPGAQKSDYSKLTLESLRSRFQDSIGEEPTKPNTGNFMRQWISELESARGIDQIAKRQGLLDPQTDINTEDMFRQTYASDDRAQYMIMHGQIDPLTFDAKEGPSMLDALNEVKSSGGNMTDFNMYRVALRTIEKSKQGIDTGVFKGGVDEAHEIVGRPEMQKYAKANEIMQQWKRGGLEYGRDSGLWSQDRLDAMEASNTSHVSLRRIMGDDAAFGGFSAGRGFRASNPLKQMEGSNRQIVEPLTADMDNARQIVKMADRNRAIGHVLGMQEVHGILGLSQLPPPEVKAMLAEPGSSVFKPYNMTPEAEKAMGAFAVEAKVRTKGSNQFVFYRNGVPEVWQAKDPYVAALMRGADSPGEADIVSKMLSIPAKLERSGILAAPDFAFRVPMRHQLTAWVLDPAHPAPYLTAIKGAMDVWKQGDAFLDLMRRGGLSGAVTEMDMAKGVDKALGDQDVLTQTGALQKAFNATMHPLHFSQMVTEKITQMERVGYYKAAVGKGIDPNKAAMMGRKAYMDFSEKATGQLANWMAQQVPFFRAAALGIRQTRDAVVDNPGKTMAYTGLGLVAPQIGLYWLNHNADKHLPEKDRYSSLPQWERDQYFVTPPIGGVRFKLARPYVIGPMVGAPVERFLEATFENNPHAFDDLASSMFSDAVPSVLPASVRPVVENMTNHSFFTGHPLVSDSLRDFTPDEQYNDNTSEVAKRISAAIGSHVGAGLANVSPIDIDNLVQGWTGTVGAVVLHSLDAPLGKPAGDRTWMDMPFVRGFVTQNPRMSTQQVTDFYNDAEKWTALHKDVSREVKEGKEDQALHDYQDVGQKAITVQHMEHALNVQRTALKAIETNDKMNLDEKRQLSNRIYNDAWQIARLGSRIMRSDPSVNLDEANAIQGQAETDINQAVQK